MALASGGLASWAVAFGLSLRSVPVIAAPADCATAGREEWRCHHDAGLKDVVESLLQQSVNMEVNPAMPQMPDLQDAFAPLRNTLEDFEKQNEEVLRQVNEQEEALNAKFAAVKEQKERELKNASRVKAEKERELGYKIADLIHMQQLNIKTLNQTKGLRKDVLTGENNLRIVSRRVNRQHSKLDAVLASTEDTTSHFDVLKEDAPALEDYLHAMQGQKDANATLAQSPALVQMALGGFIAESGAEEQDPDVVNEISGIAAAESSDEARVKANYDAQLELINNKIVVLDAYIKDADAQEDMQVKLRQKLNHARDHMESMLSVLQNHTDAVITFARQTAEQARNYLQNSTHVALAGLPHLHSNSQGTASGTVLLENGAAAHPSKAESTAKLDGVSTMVSRSQDSGAAHVPDQAMPSPLPLAQTGSQEQQTGRNSVVQPRNDIMNSLGAAKSAVRHLTGSVYEQFDDVKAMYLQRKADYEMIASSLSTQIEQLEKIIRDQNSTAEQNAIELEDAKTVSQQLRASIGEVRGFLIKKRTHLVVVEDFLGDSLNLSGKMLDVMPLAHEVFQAKSQMERVVAQAQIALKKSSSSAHPASLSLLQFDSQNASELGSSNATNASNSTNVSNSSEPGYTSSWTSPDPTDAFPVNSDPADKVQNMFNAIKEIMKSEDAASEKLENAFNEVMAEGQEELASLLERSQQLAKHISAQHIDSNQLLLDQLVLRNTQNQQRMAVASLIQFASETVLLLTNPN